ncbi:MAG: VOC family protein [Planctomycetota bacterium]
MAARIEHLGVAVPSLAEGLKLYRDLLGFEEDFREEVSSEQVRVVGLRARAEITSCFGRAIVVPGTARRRPCIRDTPRRSNTARGGEGRPKPGVIPARALRAGDATIELLEPMSRESAIFKYLEKRGPGLHHIAVEVTGLETLLPRLKAAGVKLLDEVPRPGAQGTKVAFIHPQGALGVLIELVEHPAR